MEEQTRGGNGAVEIQIRNVRRKIGCRDKGREKEMKDAWEGK